MDQVTLRAKPRTDAGTRPARRLRRDGYVPAVLYGRELDTLSVAVPSRELFAALHTEAGLNALINVEIEGAEPILTVAREIQRHPVRGEITHLDFIKVSLDEVIEAEVGVDYVGDLPAGVRDEGGFVETISASVMVEALPMAVPSGIEVDISELNIGDTLKVSDLPEIEGVTYLDDPERPLVTVLLPRLEEEEPEEEELLEGELEEGAEEGEEGEGREEAEAEASEEG